MGRSRGRIALALSLRSDDTRAADSSARRPTLVRGERVDRRSELARNRAGSESARIVDKRHCVESVGRLVSSSDVESSAGPSPALRRTYATRLCTASRPRYRWSSRSPAGSNAVAAGRWAITGCAKARAAIRPAVRPAGLCCRDVVSGSRAAGACAERQRHSGASGTKRWIFPVALASLDLPHIGDAHLRLGEAKRLEALDQFSAQRLDLQRCPCRYPHCDVRAGARLAYLVFEHLASAAEG